MLSHSHSHPGFRRHGPINLSIWINYLICTHLGLYSYIGARRLLFLYEYLIIAPPRSTRLNLNLQFIPYLPHIRTYAEQWFDLINGIEALRLICCEECVYSYYNIAIKLRGCLIRASSRTRTTQIQYIKCIVSNYARKIYSRINRKMCACLCVSVVNPAPFVWRILPFSICARAPKNTLS